MQISAGSNTIRKANSSDIPLLVLHHVTMFQSPVESELGRCYRRKLEIDIPSGMCHMWIAEVDGCAVASGGISIGHFVPTPWDHNPVVAYVHSIFTMPEHRCQGHANRILLSIDHYCKECGIHRQWLNASDMGRPIYEKLGFKPNTRMMQKDV